MFLHPRQIATVMARYPEVERYQFVITRSEHRDDLICRVMIAPDAADPSKTLVQAIREGLKFRATVEVVESIEGPTPLLDERNWND